MITVVVFALVVCAMLYIFAAFPVWVVAVCARSSSLSGSARAAWMVAMLVLFPVASWAYAIAVPNRLLFRVSAWFSLATTVTALVLVTQLSGTLAADLRSNVVQTASLMSDTAAVHTASDQRRVVTDGLSTLRREVSGNLLQWDVNASIAQLVEVLRADLDDRQLSAMEFEAWRARFGTRTVRPSGFIVRSIGIAQGFLDAVVARNSP
jgi:hypothetical protein